MQLTGFHHLTAISADIRNNHLFYTQTLGMRLVKRSVNQDDVSAYHLFYADAVGSPGTDITFFDWSMPREQRGSRSVTRTHLRIHGKDTMTWWVDRLADQRVRHERPIERDGRLTLLFEDPEGQRLALIDDGGAGDTPVPWLQSPVPVEHQIRGIGPIRISVTDIRATDHILTQVMSMRPVREYDDALDVAHKVVVYEMGMGGPHAELHVAIQPDLPPARQGAGGVHHVAFRTPTVEQYDAWVNRLAEFGVPNSGPVDRYYFRSLYFREPGGTLFEIATDGPGFAVDEQAESLGESLVLPPFLEPRRANIVAGLKPID